MQSRWFRGWIWVAIVVQCSGYVFDAVWHAVLRQGIEPKTLPEMTWHLATVHLPLYIGALAVLVTTGAALLHDARRSASGEATPLVAPQIAFSASVVSAVGEVGHAVMHLNLNTLHAPIPAIVSIVGFVVVVATMVVSGLRSRRAEREARQDLEHAAGATARRRPGYFVRGDAFGG